MTISINKPMTNQQLIEQLSQLSEPQYAAFNRKLLPGVENIMGVRVPQMRNIAKEILKADWRQFLASGPSSVYEVQFVRGLVIAQAPMDMSERLGLLSRFADEVDNWAVCDTTFGALRHVLRKAKTPSDAHLLREWAEAMALDSRTYARRAAAVVVLSCFASAEHMQWTLPMLLSIDCRGEYYAEMGVAWALSMLYFEDRQQVSECIDQLTDSRVKALARQKIRESRRV